MELWLQLQLAAAAAPHTKRPPAQGVLIARDGNRLAVAKAQQNLLDARFRERHV
jgi:hypothetical protein